MNTMNATLQFVKPDNMHGCCMVLCIVSISESASTVLYSFQFTKETHTAIPKKISIACIAQCITAVHNAYAHIDDTLVTSPHSPLLFTRTYTLRTLTRKMIQFLLKYSFGRMPFTFNLILQCWHLYIFQRQRKTTNTSYCY